MQGIITVRQHALGLLETIYIKIVQHSDVSLIVRQILLCTKIMVQKVVWQFVIQQVMLSKQQDNANQIVQTTFIKKILQENVYRTVLSILYLHIFILQTQLHLNVFKHALE